MNEHDVATMLAERAEQVEVGPAPIAAVRRQGARQRRHRVLVSAASVTALAVGAAVVVPPLLRPDTPASAPPPAAPTLASRWEGSMTITPDAARPGDLVSVRFPADATRGLAFALAPWSDGGWDEPSYYLTSDGGDPSAFQPDWWRADRPNRGWPDIGVGGAGPDHVVIPPTASAGPYLLCTANAPSEACALLTVDPEAPGWRAPTEEDLVGRWRAVEIAGRAPAPSAQGARGLDLLDIARADGRLSWSAPADCNSAGGRIRLHPDGTASATYSTTLMACGRRWGGVATAAEPMAELTRLEVAGDELRVYGADGALTGVFARAATPR